LDAYLRWKVAEDTARMKAAGGVSKN